MSNGISNTTCIVHESKVVENNHQAPENVHSINRCYLFNLYKPANILFLAYWR